MEFGCPNCSVPNVADSRFCRACGSALKACPKCETLNSGDAAYCSECGGHIAGHSRVDQTSMVAPVATTDPLTPLPTWKVVDQEERQYALKEFDLKRVALLSVANSDETGIDGTERLVRVVATSNIRLDHAALMAVRDNVKSIPLAWAEACEREDKSISFDGTVFADVQGGRYVSSMQRFQGEWRFGFVSLDNVVEFDSLSALLEVTPQTGTETLDALTTQGNHDPTPPPEFDVATWIAGQLKIQKSDKEIIDLLVSVGWTQESSRIELIKVRHSATQPVNASVDAPAESHQIVLPRADASSFRKFVQSVQSVEELFSNTTTVDTEEHVRTLEKTLVHLEQDYNKLKNGIATDQDRMRAKHAQNLTRLEATHAQNLARTEATHAENLLRMKTERVSAVVGNQYAVAKAKEERFKVLKFVTLGLGLLALIFVAWWLGLLIAISGFWYCNSSEAHYSEWRRIFERLVSNIDESELKKICGQLPIFKLAMDQALDVQSTELSQRVELEGIKSSQQMALETTRSSQNDQLRELQQLHSQVEDDYLEVCVNAVKGIADSLKQLQAKASNLPDAFDPHRVVWSPETVPNSGGGQRTSIRYGRYGNTNLDVDIPLYKSFFNKASWILSYGVDSQKRTATTIANNVVARSLLSFPAHKISVTFIDPMDLGVDADRKLTHLQGMC